MNTELTTASNELTGMLPWHLRCKLACRAMIQSRTMKEQIEFSLRQGLQQAESKKPHDQHAKNAAKFFNVSASVVTPKQRRFAKNAMFLHNFAPRGADKDTL